MVGAFGEVQVVDWGMAKVLRQSGSAAQRQPCRERGIGNQALDGCGHCRGISRRDEQRVHFMMENLADGRQIGRDDRAPRGHVLEQLQRRRKPRGDCGHRIRQAQYVGLPQEPRHARRFHHAGERDAIADPEPGRECFQSCEIRFLRMSAHDQPACFRDARECFQQHIHALPRV